MKFSLSIFLIIFLINFTVNCQTINIIGQVTDLKSGSAISYAHIQLKPYGLHYLTKENGNYSIIANQGNCELNVTSISHKGASLRFTLKKDTIINFALEILPFKLDEVTITSDSSSSIQISDAGSVIIGPKATIDFPKLMSEPDLLKSLQIIPGVISGKDGSSEIYVRGGTSGQNTIYVNGCNFFVPSHLMGIVSPFSEEFVSKTELYKDYFPPDLSGGLSSVISISFKNYSQDSTKHSVRLGLISSEAVFGEQIKKLNLTITGGVRFGNYSIYKPILKKICLSDMGSFLFPKKYSFSDNFLQLTYIGKSVTTSYLFFGNFDNSFEENFTLIQYNDILLKNQSGLIQGWNSMIHSLKIESNNKQQLNWGLNLGYNRLKNLRQTYSFSSQSQKDSLLCLDNTLYSFSPVINNLSGLLRINYSRSKGCFLSGGIYEKLRFFSPNINVSASSNNEPFHSYFSTGYAVNESSVFISAETRVARNIRIFTGLRGSLFIVGSRNDFDIEPRIRISFFDDKDVSAHISYTKLSQTDHSVEGSNLGLRSSFWFPISKDFGPEYSESYSAGILMRRGLIFSCDVFYKKLSQMIDFKPGASFMYDTSIVDLFEKTNGKAYGLELGLQKRFNNFSGILNYTYTRSMRTWNTPEGTTWIPFTSDKPHSIFLSAKYIINKTNRLGLNWTYQSGSPATMYLQQTSYGEFFDTKNNIRLFNYHRLDLSFQKTIIYKDYVLEIEADIYNLYNHKNTYYFKEMHDEETGEYYYKNVYLFPVMPTISCLIKW